MALTRDDIAMLYHDHGHRVFRKAMAFLGDEAAAKDILQDVFVRMVKSAHRIDDKEHLGPWLTTVTSRLCLNRIRDEGRRRALPLDEGRRASDSIESLHEAFLEHRELCTVALEEVDEETRAMVLEYYVDDMTLEELAQRHSSSISTVRRRLVRFLERARRKVFRRS